jgi:hypothetical protein
MIPFRFPNNSLRRWKIQVAEVPEKGSKGCIKYKGE